MKELTALKPGPKAQMKAWNGAKGIYLRISQTDKTWYWRGSLRGEKLLISLGENPRKANELSDWLKDEAGRLSKLCRAGVDPRVQPEPVPTIKIPTLAEVFHKYMEKRDPVAEETRKGDKGHWDRKVVGFKIGPKKEACLGDLPIDQLTNEMLQGLFKSMHDIPVSHNRVYRVFRQLWNYVRFTYRGKIQFVENPLEGIKQFEEDTEANPLTEDELQAVGLALKTYPHKQRFNFLFILYTGCRVGILANWQKEWVRQNQLRIPKEQQGVKKARLVRICPRAIELIPHLTACTKHSMRGLCKNLSKKAKIRSFSNHDLRDTFISIGANMGFSIDDMMLLTSHKLPKIARAYVKRSDAALLEIATKVSDRIAELLGAAASLDGVNEDVSKNHSKARLPVKRTEAITPVQSVGLDRAVKVTVETIQTTFGDEPED